MKNYEKYAEEIKKNEWDNTCKDFIEPIILKMDGCDGNCTNCRLIQMLWLFEEYKKPKEPEVDWSKVEVDTPILVGDASDKIWLRRHFAKFENGKVYTWFGSGTSWTVSATMKWNYAKLAETEGNKWID